MAFARSPEPRRLLCLLEMPHASKVRSSSGAGRAAHGKDEQAGKWGGGTGLVSRRPRERFVRGPNTREHVEALCLQAGRSMKLSEQPGECQQGKVTANIMSPPKAMEYINTSKTLKSKVSSVVKGGKKFGARFLRTEQVQIPIFP